MECIAARALKSSFLKEICMKSTQQALFEDLWSVAGIDNVVNTSTDEFFVDDLLDLSDKDFNKSDGGCFEGYSEEDEEKDSVISSNFSSTGDLLSIPAGEIHLPVDDEMENLEWLSQIVDDSTSEISLLYPAANFKKTGKFSMKPLIPSFTVLGLSYPVPRKSRSKRSKKGSRVWSDLTESSSYDSYPQNPVQVIESILNPVQLTQRRCTHCEVQKTPQWRTGPLGPKTLCNACGVRFKSGRLFPEYRPACSPTFSDDLHSNSHRKVLEMRRKREYSFGTDFRSFSC